MANQVEVTNFYSKATVNSAPDTGGYWTDPISIKALKKDFVYFFVHGSGASKITLQYKFAGSEDWQDYLDDTTSYFLAGTRKKLMDTSHLTQYRAGVKQADFSAGEIIFGFDW